MSGRYLPQSIKFSQVMREIAGTCTHVCLSVNVGFFPPFLLMCLLCWGKHLQLLPNSWSAFSPTLLLPPAWSLLGGNVAYNGPRVNHLQVSPDKSQCVCCAPSKSQQQLWGCAKGGLWHSERWPRWEAFVQYQCVHPSILQANTEHLHVTGTELGA